MKRAGLQKNINNEEQSRLLSGTGVFLPDEILHYHHLFNPKNIQQIKSLNWIKSLLWFFIFLLYVSTLSGRSLYKIEGNNVIVDLEGIGVKSRILKVEMWSDRTIKIVSGMDVNFSTFPSLIQSGQPLPVKFKVGYTQNNIEISTKNIIVSVLEDGLVSIFNRDGNKLILESDRFFEPSKSIEAKFKIKQRFFLSVHENIYGFGWDDSTKRYNLRDCSFTQVQTRSKIASPVFYSEKGYALIWDNYSSTLFNDKKSGLEISSDLGDEIQYFLIYGPSWDEIIAEIRNLTGKVPMLPRWTFGQWLFPGNYGNMNVFNETIQKYSESGIPVETGTTPDYSLFLEEINFIPTPGSFEKRLTCAAAYSEMKNKYSELQKLTYNRRLCIPTYSNYPGIQKFGTFLITGEVKPDWETLKGQVIAGINLSLSGQPYWSTSIGGNKPPDPKMGSLDELLLRWYQFATFTPVFRAPKPEYDLLSLKMKSDINFNIILKAIRLRYSLLPYIYSTINDVALKDETFVRSLMFDYPKNEKVHTIDQQYMFGKSFMICPVTSPSVVQLPVYLPEGSNWYDFWTGKIYEGNSNQNVNVSTDHIPVFVKSGSIIPLATIGGSSSDSLSAPVELRIFPGNNATFTLYEDFNDGMSYTNGQHTQIKIDYTEKDKSLSIGSIEGTYNGMIADRIFKVVMVTDSTGIGSEMSEIFQKVSYKGKKIKLKIGQP
jgi:alpha-glucosidase (family GH31 glycosyl hydrolase)